MWTLFCTGLSGLALSWGSSGHCPDMKWWRLRYFHPDHYTFISGLYIDECVKSTWPGVVLSNLAWIQC